MPKTNLIPTNNRQLGLSLVELMVSMTIGLVIVLFVSALYLSSRQSQRITDDSMRIQQETNMIMNLLGRNLMQAGFGNLSAHKKTDLDGNGLMACDFGFASPTGTSIMPECAAATSGLPPGFQVRYRVEGAYSSNTGAGADCNNQNVDRDSAAQGVAMNRFYVRNNSLNCAGNGNFNFPQPLLGNVEDMRLRFAVDTDGDRSPDMFTNNASDVTDWKNVVSVNVCLQVVSDNNVTPAAQTYVDCTGTSRTATDRRLRTVLNRVFTLRNNAAARNNSL